MLFFGAIQHLLLLQTLRPTYLPYYSTQGISISFKFIQCFWTLPPVKLDSDVICYPSAYISRQSTQSANKKFQKGWWCWTLQSSWKNDLNILASTTYRSQYVDAIIKANAVIQLSSSYLQAQHGMHRSQPMIKACWHAELALSETQSRSQFCTAVTFNNRL